MNAVLAFRNDIRDLVEPKLASVVGFKRTPRNEPYIMNREDYCIKDPCITDIEWTVNEHVLIEVQ